MFLCLRLSFFEQTNKMLSAFLYLSSMLCEKYTIKLCLLENVYVAGPSDPTKPVSDYVKSNVSFGKVSGSKNLRYIKSEDMDNYIYSYLESGKKLILTPFYTGDDKMLEIVPDDYVKCHRITRDKKCFSYNIDRKEFVLEECVKNEPTQLFDFNCVDCDPMSKSESSIIDLHELKHKMGRLGVDTYKKLMDVAKMMQTVSKCFTQNQTCNENSTELIPLSCFGSIAIANHIDEASFIYDTARHKFEFDTGKKNKNHYKVFDVDTPDE